MLGHAAIERIAGGCRFTEGPVWFGDTRQLLWSDIPNDRLMRYHEETGAVTRRPGRAGSIVVKTIYATFSLEWLVARYEPKVIAMQRNPLNVVSSWRELRIPLFDLATRPIIRSRYIEPLGIEPPGTEASDVAQIAWHVGLLTHVIAQSLENHPEWHFVTHEDLCQDPVTTIRSICDQVGLTWTDDIDRFLNENNRRGEGLAPVRIATEEPTRWRERLSTQEIAEIENVLQAFPTRGWIRPPVTAS